MKCDSSLNEFIIRTNTRVEAYKALEKFEETLKLVENDIYQWKWAIIILHNCLQCFMVVLLEGTNQSDVIKDNTKEKKHIAAHLSANKDWNPEKTKLDDFLSLYSKVRKYDDNNYLNDMHDLAIEIISKSRNDFSHFFPKGFSIWVHPFPRQMYAIIEVIEYIVLNSGKVYYKYEENELNIIKDKIFIIKHMLSDLDIKMNKQLKQMRGDEDAI